MRRRRELLESAAAVAVGGAAGSAVRFQFSQWWPDDRLAQGAFPWTTFLINTIGCLSIGVLVTVLASLSAPHRLVRPVLGTGFLGGFTTFSGQVFQATRLVEAGHAAVALIYVVATLVVALVAVRLGVTAVRSLGSERKRR